MSRSGYSDDCTNDALNLWRGAVDRAIKGRRGQAFLREMASALDAMPVKELIVAEVVDADNRVCAIGSVALARHMDVSHLDASEPDDVAARFGIARALAAEIAYENDECDDDGPPEGWLHRETPSERWSRMRAWVDKQLMPPMPSTDGDDNG